MRRIVLIAFHVLAIGLLPVSGQAEDNDLPRTTVLDPIVITGTKTSHTLEDVPVETVLVSREDIEKSNAQNVSSLLTQIPGFNFSQQPNIPGSMGCKNTLRGLNVESRYMLILVDGQRVFTGYRSGGMTSAGFSHNVNVVPVSMIDHIEVVKGPGSALYGSDAMVGVLNIITKKPTKKLESTLGGSYGRYEVAGNDFAGTKAKATSRYTYESHATLAGPLNNRIRGTVSLSHEGNEGTNPTRYDVHQTYLHSQLEMDVTESLKLRGGAEFADWISESVAQNDKKTEQAPRFWAVSDYAISDKHNIKLQGYYQKLKADFSDNTYGKQRADVSYSSAELQYSGNIFDHHLATVGAEVLQESLDTNSVANKGITTTSVYLQDEWDLLDGKVVIVPGVRFDNNSDYGSVWNPKLNAMYTPVPGTRIRAATGWSFKAPSAMQTSAEPITDGVYMWLDPNPDLEPERAFTWQIGVEQDLFDKRLVVGVTYYDTTIDHMITTVDTGAIRAGLPVYTYENIDKARLRGIEASANIQIMDPLSLMLTYAFTDARNTKTDKRLPDTPEHAFGAQMDYTNRKYGFGATATLKHTTDQLNSYYATHRYAKDFTTVGLKVWKDLGKSARISLMADNIFDEPLRGSDTIYVRRSLMSQLEFTF